MCSYCNKLTNQYSNSKDIFHFLLYAWKIVILLMHLAKSGNCRLFFVKIEACREIWSMWWSSTFIDVGNKEMYIMNRIMILIFMLVIWMTFVFCCWEIIGFWICWFLSDWVFCFCLSISAISKPLLWRIMGCATKI